MSSRWPTGKLGGPFSLHAPTTVIVRAPSYWTMFAPGSPSSRPTSSVACSNTRLGGASPATSVATLRSAACSAASVRCADSAAASLRAARIRSAVTAASSSEVTAAMAMKSCVASRLSVSEARTNGPSFSAVFQTVIEHTMRIAVAAPRGPKRSAAHRSAGNTRYGTSRWGASSASTRSTTSTTPPSATSRRRMPRRPKVAQASSAGATTSAPAASPSVHVLKTSSSSDVVITPPRRSASGPKAALTSAATSAQPMKATTSNTRPSPVRPLVRRRISSAATTSATVFPIVWASTVPSGVEKSPSRRSPITMPGTSRGPYRISTARPSPAGGQIAATAPSR